jgi:hypothetical protein
MGKLKNYHWDELTERTAGDEQMNLPEETTFTPAPAGAHTAVCIGFVDMGTQPKSPFYEDSSPAHKVRITWELDEMMDDGKPFTISKTYTWSMSDRATLRAHLESWRGKPFRKEDFGAGGFDTKNLLGAYATLTVQHKEINGDTRAVVAGAAPIMKGIQKFTPHNSFTYLTLDPAKFDAAVFEKLGEKTRELIKASPEYAAIHSTKNGADKYSDRVQHTDDLDDEIPF